MALIKISSVCIFVSSCGLFGGNDDNNNNGNEAPPPAASVAPSPSSSIPSVAGVQAVSYLTHIKPHLDGNCVNCHNGSSISPDLREFRSDLSDAEHTAFWNLSVGRVENGTMPPTGALEAGIIQLFQTWRLLGYPYDDSEASAAAQTVSADSLQSANQCVQNAYETNGIIPLSKNDLDRTFSDLFYAANLPSRYGYATPKFSDYQNMLSALEVIPQEVGGKGFTKGPSDLSLAHIEAYSNLAENVATGVMGNPDIYQVLEGSTIVGATEGQLQWSSCLNNAVYFGDDPTRQGELETCVKNFLGEIGKKAYRRPLSQGELDRLYQVFLAGRGTGDSIVTDGLKLALEAILQSPFFLNRVELGTQEGEVYKLSNFELASKLAYTIWGRPPDSELLEAAERDLSNPQTLATTVDRMFNVEKWGWKNLAGPSKKE